MYAFIKKSLHQAPLGYILPPSHNAKPMETIYPTFKFRAYPTKEQEAKLVKWADSCRFLWNLAHEQRLLGAITDLQLLCARRQEIKK